MEERTKFSESEILIGALFTLGVDGLSALIDFTGVGLAIAPVIQGASVFAIDRWIENKGGGDFGLGKKFAQYAAGFIPLLPTTTGVFAVRVFMHNHPQATQVAGKVVSKVLKKAA